MTEPDEGTATPAADADEPASPTPTAPARREQHGDGKPGGHSPGSDWRSPPVSGLSWLNDFLTRPEARMRLLRISHHLGGRDNEERSEAVNLAMTEVAKHAATIEDPIAYASRAIEHHLGRIHTRQRRQAELALQFGGAAATASRDELDVAMFAHENREWVLQVLNTLTPDQRSAMAMLMDGHSQTEIAELEGVSLSVITSRVDRARKALRNHEDIKRLHRAQVTTTASKPDIPVHPQSERAQKANASAASAVSTSSRKE